jgi:carbon-monoxide dehydrogenase medium subunit
MDSRPVRAAGVESALAGASADTDSFTAAAAHAAEGTNAPSDTNGSAEYRNELVKVLVRRALEEASAG